MKPLTARQTVVYDYIVESLQEQGIPPTVREIANGLGFKSLNSVREHLRLIEKKGFVELRPGVARGIFPKNMAEEIQEDSGIDPESVNVLPIVGNVAAGTPITAEENIDSSLVVDNDLFGGDNLFVFRVNGDSMVEAGVENGDFVVVHKQNSARDGEKVVALIDGDTTLKTYYKKPEHIILHPENEVYNDIIVTPEQSFSIAGKMVGLIRRC
jgi:repressor LexA